MHACAICLCVLLLTWEGGGGGGCGRSDRRSHSRPKPALPDAYLAGHNKLLNYLNFIFQTNRTQYAVNKHTRTHQHIRNAFAASATWAMHSIQPTAQSISANRFNAITHGLCYLSHTHQPRLASADRNVSHSITSASRQ